MVARQFRSMIQGPNSHLTIAEQRMTYNRGRLGPASAKKGLAVGEALCIALFDLL